MRGHSAYRLFGSALLAALLAIAGCRNGQSPSQPEKGGEVKETHKHSGWWCEEHGLPEEICDQCDRKYAAAEKAKGNWCEHGRVKTSCFICTPDLKQRLAKEYAAHFPGEELPKSLKEEPGKQGKSEK